MLQLLRSVVAQEQIWQAPQVAGGGLSVSQRRLLATGALEAVEVRAYVDSDSAGAPRTFAGRPVLAPADLVHRSETIFVASRPFADEIVSKIRNELGLKNRVVLVP